MEEDYKIDQDASMVDGGNNGIEGGDSLDSKEFGDMGYDEAFEDEDGNGFRNNRGRGNYRNNRGRPPHNWMNGPPMGPRFRGRGYGPQGPPMRGRGFFRGRGGPRFNNTPNFDNNWGPMGPPPPGMMGGPPPFGPPPGMMPPGGPMGPPPNMMGQPPPFGGPPGMPPPSMPHGELWVETKSEDGKSYFYHARTRETTWTRPQEGPTCKIVSQAEMEAMVAAGQPPPQSMGMGGQQMPMGMGGPMPGMMPGQVPPFMNQPPPWMKDASQNQPQDDQSPADNDEMPPGESAPLQPPSLNQPPPTSNPPMGFPGMPGAPNFSQAPPNFNPSQAGPPGGPGGPPGGYPGGPGGPPGGFPGGWGGWGGWPPPLVAQPPPNLAAAAVPDSGGVGVSGGHIAPTAYPPVSAHNGPQAVYTVAGVPGTQGPPGGQGGWSGWPPLVAQPPPRAKAAVPDKGAATQQNAQMALKPPGLAKLGVPGQMPLLPAKIGMPSVANPMVASEVIRLSDSPPPQTDQEKADGTVIPPELIAAAAAWTTHKSPDGRPYYFHAANQESVWEKPKPLKDLHELQAKINREKAKFDMDPNKVIEVMDDEDDDTQAAAEAAAIAAVEAERKSAAEKEKAEKERLEKEKAEKERLEKEKAEKEKADKEKAKADKSRPVSSTPISGTPWCVVWTGDGRVFFYNPTAHTSVWERPAQLIGRSDVDKAVSQPVHDQKKDGAATTPVKSSNGDMKRANTDSDDSDSEPIKKSKQDDIKKSNQIDVGKEAAIEAEVAAARQRGVVPHEQRLRSFLQMLHEKQVSAFSTWEKELHKIVFDSRYLMLNSKERRQVFDQYVRDRAEEERKEKKNRLQQKKLIFRALMEEAKLHSKSSFNDFSSKHGRDERFKSIEKTRDRELYFNEYLAELRKREKEDKEKKREQVKADYLALLKEKGIDRHARFQDVKKKVYSDPRYKAVEGGAAREDYFREYCKQLKDDRRKDKDSKDRDRSVKKDKKEKERDKDKDGKEGKEGKESKKKKEKGEAKKEDPPPAEEPEPEDVDMESTEDTAAKEKKARAQASIKEREREVQRALATSLRDRDKEREQHKRDEAVQHFNALLADLVRNPELAWREAKKQLKKDHRYNLAELLSKEDKERLFTQHTSSLASKRRDKLRTILTDLGVGCTSHWKEVKDMLKNEPTTPVYSSSSTIEREFRDYQRDKQTAAKTQLRQLLQETRSITHKSLQAVKEHTAAMDAVHASLKQDARYLALEHIPDERQSIIMSYLEELDKKGPPPPPTATEPSRRPKP